MIAEMSATRSRVRRAAAKARKAEAALERDRAELRAAILEARAAGETLRTIAEDAGLTHGRIHQIEAGVAR